MKKIQKASIGLALLGTTVTVLAVAFAGCHTPLPADTTQFEYVRLDDGVRIANYNGTGSVITIPSRINGLPVTGIGEYAFTNCTNATCITVPSSVHWIDMFVFASNLTFYFCGNAPAACGNQFECGPTEVIYHQPSTTGWESTFCDRPTAIWTTDSKTPANAHSK